MKRKLGIILTLLVLAIVAVSAWGISSIGAVSIDMMAPASPTADLVETNCGTGFNCGRIAYIEHRFGQPQYYRLWTRNTDGSNRTPVLSFGPSSGNYANGLIFSPDNSKLYFSASENGTFDKRIFSVNVDGTGLTRLTNSCLADPPSFSPNGTTLLFIANCGEFEGDQKVYLMNPDGSGMRRLTTHSIANSDVTSNGDKAASFSPDGSQVVFSSQAGSTGTTTIYLSSFDGLNVVALTNYADHGSTNRNPRFASN